MQTADIQVERHDVACPSYAIGHPCGDGPGTCADLKAAGPRSYSEPIKEPNRRSIERARERSELDDRG
jgi:hypothetical protein